MTDCEAVVHVGRGIELCHDPTTGAWPHLLDLITDQVRSCTSDIAEERR